VALLVTGTLDHYGGACGILGPCKGCCLLETGSGDDDGGIWDLGKLAATVWSPCAGSSGAEKGWGHRDMLVKVKERLELWSTTRTKRFSLGRREKARRGGLTKKIVD
jgi:hypothetical protein